MFDNHQNPPANNTPTNLPMGEPDDMFSNADSLGADFAEPTNVPVPIPPGSEAEPASQGGSAAMPPTALDAGVLRPRNVLPTNTPIADEDIERGLPAEVPMRRETAPTMLNSSTLGNGGVYGQSSARSSMQSPAAPTAAMSGVSPENVLRDPMGGRKVWVTIVVLVSLGLVSAAGAWVYFNYINPPATTILPNNPVVVPTTTNSNTNQPIIDNQENNESDANVTSTDNQILFGDPVLDTDSDGLDDEYEKKNGTDMLLWDTDSDTLSDGDEVLTWKTDPKKSDTDGDTYPDGVEIRNGYNPRGDGKLFPTPTTTTSEAKP